MKNISIRKCQLTDLVEANSLYQQLNHDQENFEPLADRLSDYSLVAEINGMIVGLIVAEVQSTELMVTEIGRDAFPDEKTYLEIQELYVLPEHRGGGIRSSLIKKELDTARANGIQRSMVYSANNDYIRTAKFYEKNGFKMWHIFMTQ